MDPKDYMGLPGNSKRKKLLIITSSGGGGHVQAAKAEAVKAMSEDPLIEIIEKDLLIDLVSKRFGKGFVFLWNASQKRGNIGFLMLLLKNIPTADFLFGTFIFTRILFTLLKEGIDRIIDTQPIGTAATIKAIKIARKLTGKPLVLEKIVTELPTDNVIHFFKPIKKLSANNRKVLKLISTTPLLKNDETPEGFWQTNCKLSEREVEYKDFPLRPAFERFKSSKHFSLQRIPIKIKVNSAEEKFLISDTIKKGTIPSEIYRDKIVITIEPSDKVSTILLGSQPTEEATIKYVKNYISLMKQVESYERHLLFVFCNAHIEHKNSLLKKVHNLIQKTAQFPHTLNVIPMCFQSDEVIAPLYYRSNATFTRSGGLTAMELMTVAQGQIWIHSETRHVTNDGVKLERGMPIWERGNAAYLKEMKGARFITPETFIEGCLPYFFPQKREDRHQMSALMSPSQSWA